MPKAMADLKAKLEAAESMCAEMREALQHVFNWKGKLGFYPPLIAQVDKALSSACGTGYKSPDEWSKFKSELWDIINRRTEERDKSNLKAIALEKENDRLRQTLKVIAKDIGSSHAATKAQEALDGK